MSDPDWVEGQMPQPQPDFAAVVAEIEDEARRTRAAGDTPVELIERLDAEFDRFAPRSHHRTGVEGAIRSVEAAAFINSHIG